MNRVSLPTQHGPPKCTYKDDAAPKDTTNTPAAGSAATPIGPETGDRITLALQDTTTSAHTVVTEASQQAAVVV